MEDIYVKIILKLMEGDKILKKDVWRERSREAQDSPLGNTPLGTGDGA